MSKFSDLFLVSIAWCFMGLVTVQAAPVDYLLFDGLTNDEPAGDYDMLYDQRQNGTENFRLNIDGVIMAFPAAATSQASNTAANVAANYLLQLASALDDEDDNNDESDTTNYFPFVKNANKDADANSAFATDAKSPSAPQQQVAGDEKTSPKPAAEYSTESGTADSVAALNIKRENVADIVERIGSMSAGENTPKVVVVPVKKIQGRRKNK